MADEKKEVHVKDLIVRADNVVFERNQRDHDFFFGPRRPRHEEVAGEHTMEEHQMEEEVEDHVEDKHDDDDHRDRRPPFFWM